MSVVKKIQSDNSQIDVLSGVSVNQCSIWAEDRPTEDQDITIIESGGHKGTNHFFSVVLINDMSDRLLEMFVRWKHANLDISKRG